MTTEETFRSVDAISLALYKTRDDYRARLAAGQGAEAQMIFEAELRGVLRVASVCELSGRIYPSLFLDLRSIERLLEGKEVSTELKSLINTTHNHLRSESEWQAPIYAAILRGAANGAEDQPTGPDSGA